MSKQKEAITLIKKQRDMHIKMRENLKDTLGVENKRYKKIRLKINEEIQVLDYILMKIGGTNDEAK
jgi:hypothetical protein